MTRNAVAPEYSRASEYTSSEADLLHGLVFPLFALRGHLVDLIDEACDGMEVTATEAVVLLHLLNGSLTVSELTRAAGLQRSGGSVLADRLMARRLIKRSASPIDRRIVNVSLTPAGRKVATDLTDRLASISPDLMGGLSAVERHDIFAGLQRVAELQSASH